LTISPNDDRSQISRPACQLLTAVSKVVKVFAAQKFSSLVLILKLKTKLNTAFEFSRKSTQGIQWAMGKGEAGKL